MIIYFYLFIYKSKNKIYLQHILLQHIDLFI